MSGNEEDNFLTGGDRENARGRRVNRMNSGGAFVVVAVVGRGGRGHVSAIIEPSPAIVRRKQIIVIALRIRAICPSLIKSN